MFVESKSHLSSDIICILVQLFSLASRWNQSNAQHTITRALGHIGLIVI